MYFKYFKHLIKHKWKVFKKCWKRGYYIHAFIHDLSAFLPDEFFACAEYYFGKKDEVFYEAAQQIHFHRNKHHFEYWNLPENYREEGIPEKYIELQLLDWDNPREYYRKYRTTMKISNFTRIKIVKYLNRHYPKRKVLVYIEGSKKVKPTYENQYTDFTYVRSMTELRKYKLNDYDHLILHSEFVTRYRDNVIQYAKVQPHGFLIHLDVTFEKTYYI